MTKSEYQELVEFISPKFDRIGSRFDAIDKRDHATIGLGRGPTAVPPTAGCPCPSFPSRSPPPECAPAYGLIWWKRAG